MIDVSLDYSVYRRKMTIKKVSRFLIRSLMAKRYNGSFRQIIVAKLFNVISMILTYVFALVHNGLLMHERVGQQEGVLF